MSQLYWLPRGNSNCSFPPVDRALSQPPGLLAAGGDLSPARLTAAYKAGIFPWYEAGQPILWWSPDPRAVLWPDRLHVSRSLTRTIKREIFTTTYDQAFDKVTDGCAAEREGQHGTWITPEMNDAYRALHQLGIAHSIETWRGDELAGGLYGVSLGRVFFAESMFSRYSDASKVALHGLVSRLQSWNYTLVDCQMTSTHLLSLGVTLMPRNRFVVLLAELCGQAPASDAWTVHGDERA